MMLARHAWRKALLLLIGMMALVLPLLAFGGKAPTEAHAAEVTVHPAVRPRVLSRSVRSLPMAPRRRTVRVVPEGVGETRRRGPAPAVPRGPDPVLQRSFSGTTETTRLRSFGDSTENHGLLSSPIVNFDGLSTGSQPMDPTGDMGPNHYVQIVNSQFQIFNKAGTSLAGPTNINQLWAAAGDTTECATTNDGDPIVLYDHLADRWLLSQFDATGPNFGMCIAISRTPDPTGTYYLYRFVIPAGQGTFPDYPKFGVWPDGYYMSSFEGSSGLGPYVFERSMMLTGNPSRVIEYGKVSEPSAPAGFRTTRMLPSDLDGPSPPAGSPNFFLRPGEDVQGVTDRLDLFEATVNWGDPPTSSFTLVQTLTPAAFAFFACANDAQGNPRLCIDQPNSSTQLDALMGRPMWRLQYRNFGSYETLVVNQTVDADGNGNAGIRWYELRRTPPGSGSWTIQQQGTYAPQAAGVTDATWVQRWMGSAAMDKEGNIALAYNVVNADNANPIYPSIRYTGRVAGDPVGILPQGEETIINGTSPSTATRWGDYTHLSVDPADGCTFWYTAEYIAASNVRRTRVASFRFPSCGATDLEIAKTDSPDPALAGGQLRYTISVTNNGPANATNLVVSDTLPSGVTFLSRSIPCTGAGSVKTCMIGNLAAGATSTFTIMVQIPADFLSSGGVSTRTITNTATVSAAESDPNTVNSTATATTVIQEQADLRLSKECKPDQPTKQPAGTETFCEIYVDNLGPSDARHVVVADRIISTTPITILSITSTTTAGTPAICPATPIGPTTSTTITCNDTVLPAGARDTIKVSFTANEAGDVDDTATVSSDTPDPSTSNNSAVGRVSFGAAADLVLSKTDTPDPVTAGTNLTYSLTVTNNGSSAAANVVVRDVLPARVSFVSATRARVPARPA